MKRLACAGVAVLLGMAACGGDDDDAADAAPSIDARNIVRTNRAYVVTKIYLPKTTEDVDEQAFEFPGTGRPVNQIGGLTTVLLDLAQGLGVDESLQAGIDEGTTLHVYVVSSGPLDEDDPGVSVQFAQAEDADDPPDPSNNLGGQGQLRVLTGTSLGTFADDAALESGAIEGTGQLQHSFVYLMQLHPEVSLGRTPGVFPKLRCTTVTESQLSCVQGSLVTLETLQSDLYPAVAELLTYAIQNGAPRAVEIKGIFDANADDTVTTTELIENDTMASLTSPDVDTDGDGTNDHLSQGLKFDAVPVELLTD